MTSIDLLTAFESEPEQQDFIWPGFLKGTVGALIAPGSTGKSFYAMQAAVAVACANPSADTLGLKLNPSQHGGVLYLNLEDPRVEICRRLFELGGHFDLQTRKCVSTGLEIFARHGIGTNVMDDKYCDELVSKAMGKRLLVIDTISRAHRLDENSNGEMAQLIARLEAIAHETGAGILYLHHTSKSAAMSGQGAEQQAARGASALIDNVRWAGNLVKMRVEQATALNHDGQTITADRRQLYIRLENSKQNYGEPIDGQWFFRTGGGVLKPVRLTARSSIKTTSNGKVRGEA
jgi:RecA-family ATPase